MNDSIAYLCSDCGLWIDGESPDPQASALLYCPSCRQEMKMLWERGKPRRVETLPLVREFLNERQEPGEMFLSTSSGEFVRKFISHAPAGSVVVLDEAGSCPGSCPGRGKVDTSLRLARKWAGVQPAQRGEFDRE